MDKTKLGKIQSEVLASEFEFLGKDKNTCLYNIKVTTPEAQKLLILYREKFGFLCPYKRQLKDSDKGKFIFKVSPTVKDDLSYTGHLFILDDIKIIKVGKHIEKIDSMVLTRYNEKNIPSVLSIKNESIEPIYFTGWICIEDLPKELYENLVLLLDIK
jgi:hypothetical protein